MSLRHVGLSGTGDVHHFEFLPISFIWQLVTRVTIDSASPAIRDVRVATSRAGVPRAARRSTDRRRLAFSTPRRSKSDRVAGPKAECSPSIAAPFERPPQDRAARSRG